MSEDLINILKMVELIKDEDVRQDVLLYLLEKNKTNVNKRYLKILEMKFRNRNRRKYRKYEALDIDISINISNISTYTQIEEGELRSLMIEYFGKDFFEYEETGRMPPRLVMRIRRRINRYRKIFKDWI